MDLDKLDTEQLVAYEGCEYRLSNGNNGLQINIKTCPKCGSDSYKVYLNAESGLGNCFKCSTGFNKYTFIKYSRGLTQHGDVMRYIESIDSIVSYRPKYEYAPAYREMNKDWVLPQNFKIELEEDLPQYLKDRNVDAKLAKRFDLRICEYGFYEYKDFHGRDRSVDFSQRIIIPIRSIDNELVTFQARDITGLSNKKYLFPNMLPGTGRFIYNANYAIENNAKVVILNEGVFDVFATTSALESDLKYRGYVACGTFGKHLSISKSNVRVEDQLSDLYKLKEAGVEEFVLLWDGESEAIRAAIETVLKLNSFGLNSSIAVIGGGLDPAETAQDVLLAAIDNRKKPSPLDAVRMKFNYE